MQWFCQCHSITMTCHRGCMMVPNDRFSEQKVFCFFSLNHRKANWSDGGELQFPSAHHPLQCARLCRCSGRAKVSDATSCGGEGLNLCGDVWKHIGSSVSRNEKGDGQTKNNTQTLPDYTPAALSCTYCDVQSSKKKAGCTFFPRFFCVFLLFFCLFFATIIVPSLVTDILQFHRILDIFTSLICIYCTFVWHCKNDKDIHHCSLPGEIKRNVQTVI